MAAVPWLLPYPAGSQQPTVRAYLLALVLTCLLPGGLGVSALVAYQWRQSHLQLEQTTVLTARAMVQAVDNHLLKVQAVAQSLAGSDALLQGDLGRFHGEAREAIRVVGLGTNVVVRDVQGRQLLNTVVDWRQPLSVPPAPEQVQAVFETGEPHISDLFLGPFLRRPIMSVDVPVLQGGQVRYALGVGVLPAHFNRILAVQKMPASWVVAVVDRRGVIAGRTLDPEATVGQFASPSLLTQMDRQSEGAGQARTREGLQVQVFYSRSPVTGWTVAIGIPQREVDAVLVRTVSWTALGVVTLFAAGLLLARRIGGAIARAFETLRAGAQALGAGQPVQVPPLRMKEAAEVAASLRSAAGLLAQRSAGERQALQALREADQRKDEFIAVLAHELRNPLAPVRTAVAILRSVPSADPRAERAREVVERQVAHMARLVDDLLDVSRITRGRLALRRERCDLAAIARQTVQDYRPAVEAAGLQLALHTPQPVPWVDGDPVRLAQMLGNLLNNAVRFTERGGRVQVRVWADTALGLVRMQVSDTGVGIEPQLLARLFEPFSQADQDAARSKGGLGLGLALTRGLAQLHGGQVEARSEGVGRGACFTLVLPLAPAA